MAFLRALPHHSRSKWALPTAVCRYVTKGIGDSSYNYSLQVLEFLKTLEDVTDVMVDIVLMFIAHRFIDL